VTEDQDTFAKAVRYANYLNQQVLEEEEGISSEKLLERSKNTLYNNEDTVADFSSAEELEDHKAAFDIILVR